MLIRKARWTAATLLVTGLCAAPAQAGQAVGQFNVTATVLTDCAVSASDLAFGNYDANQGTPLQVSTTVSVTCTDGLAYTVALDGGSNAQDVTARAMTDGSAHNLAYGLYTTNAYSNLWGDGTGGTVMAGTGNGSAQPLTVYGRIATAQFVPAGGYSDRIAVTVNY